MRFENPTRPPFLWGGQHPWCGRSYSPSELRYTPRPVSQPHRSKSHSPRFRMLSAHPYHGCHDGLPSGPFWLTLIYWLLTVPKDTIPPCWVPRYTGPAQGGLVPSPTSAFTPVCCQSRTPSPSPFYDFTGYRLEEHSFVSSLCDEIGTVGDLQSVAASLGFKFSRVEQILMSFPHDFPAAVFATLAGWYTASQSMFWEKLDDLEAAFKEMHKGALFNHIVNAHSVVLQCVSLLPRIRRPTSDTSDESLGEAVMNAIEIIPAVTYASYALSSGKYYPTGICSPWQLPVASPQPSWLPAQNPRCVHPTRPLGCFFRGSLSPTSSQRQNISA